MRSSALAEEAISRGIECVFVGSILDLDWVSERIANLGFSQVVADEAFFDPDKELDILILDTYSIPVSNRFISSKNWKLVLSICDAITPKYESDIELRPGLIAVQSGSEAPLLLSGAEFILIRKEISKSKKVKIAGDATKVLLMGGGSDPFGFVEAISVVLGSLEMNLEVHVFVDGKIPENSRVRFVKHAFGSDLDRIANDMDVVFTTASTSSLEFIAREIPTGVVCAVDNQEDYYNQLGKLGYASQLGVFNSSGAWDFDLASIKELLESQKKQLSLKQAIRSLIDLRGAERVVDTLTSLATRPKN